MAAGRVERLGAQRMGNEPLVPLMDVGRVQHLDRDPESLRVPRRLQRLATQGLLVIEPLVAAPLGFPRELEMPPHRVRARSAPRDDVVRKSSVALTASTMRWAEP